MVTTEKIQSIGLRADGLLFSEFSLVPQSLYREEDKDLWVNFLRDNLPRNQRLKTEVLAAFDCVLVYEQQEAATRHVIALLCKALEQQEEGTVVAMVCTGERTAVAVKRDGRLEFANIFLTKAAEDVLYYTLTLYEQVGLPQQTPLYIIPDCRQEVQQLLNRYLFVNLL